MTGHSEELNELAAALVKVQAGIRLVEPNRSGCIQRDGEERCYRYADLASLWAAVRRLLTRHGLAVLQTCEPSTRGELRLTTTLLHQSGQWIAGTESISMSAATAQAYGSALTYARRYGLAAILGICVDDDDDGAAASETAASNGQSQGGWRRVPYNRASQRQLKAFAQAYAEAKGLEAVSSEDIRRDFGIDGKLTDHFGARLLGDIVASLQPAAQSSAA